MHAATGTGTKLRTEPQREDEQKWASRRRRRSTAHQLSQHARPRHAQEWVSPRNEAASITAAKTAGSGDKRPHKQKLEQATTSNTGSDDSRPVPPRSAPCCSRAAPNRQPWRPVPFQCRLKTLPAGRSPCWTATQTLDEERSLHRWRSIQEQLQKVQHNIQSALNKRRDSGRILKQMKVRLHNIAQDMYNQKILNRSCGEDIVRSSLARARKAAPEKRRRPRAAEWGEACQTGLQRHHRKSDFLNRRGCSPEEARSDLRRITTQLHHTQHVQHCLPPSHHHLLHKCGTASWSVLNSLRLEGNKTSIIK